MNMIKNTRIYLLRVIFEYLEYSKCLSFRCVFWSSYGHPCLANFDHYDTTETPLPLTPGTFLSFFNI